MDGKRTTRPKATVIEFQVHWKGLTRKLQEHSPELYDKMLLLLRYEILIDQKAKMKNLLSANASGTKANFVPITTLQELTEELSYLHMKIREGMSQELKRISAETEGLMDEPGSDRSEVKED